MAKGKFILALLFIASCFLSDAAVFTKKQFFSPALNRDGTYFVSLPTGYSETDTTKKFPVIIFLHGASVTAQDIVTQLELALTNPFLGSQFQNLYNVIFVIPDGSAPPYLGSFYTNSELYGNFEDFIATDLISEIDSNYNTWDYREKWSIMGHSMGGYGTTKIALRNPDLFIGFAALSGPLHTTYYNDILPAILAENGGVAPYSFSESGRITKLIYSMAGAFSPDTTATPPVIFPILSDGTLNQEIIPLWETNNPINMIGEWKGEPNMAIFLYCGALDEYKILSMNQLFSDSLTHYNIQHTFINDPAGDHVVSLFSSFPQGLNFLVNVMDTATIRTEPNAVNRKKIATEKVYPNPAKEFIYIASDSKNAIKRVAIRSLSGSVIKNFEINGLNLPAIEIADLVPGSYLLEVAYSNGQYKHTRFVKSK